MTAPARVPVHVAAVERVQALVDRALAGRTTVHVLEAGCGAVSRLRLPPGTHIVGVDISPAQLARNTHVQETIHADIQALDPARDLGGRRFDLIVSWDLLEHLPRPTAALDALAAALAPGGLLVLALPNLWSLKGLVTKATPWGAHVWFYKHVIGDRRAGTSDFEQFPTHLHRDVAPGPLAAHLRALGLEVEHLQRYRGPVQQALHDKGPLLRWPLSAMGAVSRALSGGALDLDASDMLVVARRPG